MNFRRYRTFLTDRTPKCSTFIKYHHAIDDTGYNMVLCPCSARFHLKSSCLRFDRREKIFKPHPKRFGWWKR